MAIGRKRKAEVIPTQKRCNGSSKNSKTEDFELVRKGRIELFNRFKIFVYFTP